MVEIHLPKFKSPKDLSKKDILTLAGAIVILIALPLTIILFRRYQETRIKAFENAQIVDGTVKITNIHAHGFTVSWATVGASSGVVQWGPAGQALVQTAYDDQDEGNASFSSSTHHVTLPYPPGSDQSHPLFENPEQAFDLKILSGDGQSYGGTFDNIFDVIDVSPQASPIRVTTGPELAESYTAYGTFVSGGELYQSLVDSNGQDSWYRICPITTGGVDFANCGDWSFVDLSNSRCPIPIPDVAPGCPDPVYGDVQRHEGTAAPGTIVYLTLKDGDGQDSSGSAAPLSTITGADGRYTIDLGNARAQGFSSYFAYNRSDGDLEDISAEGGIYGQASLKDNSTSNDEPIPTLVLNHPPVIEPIADYTAAEGQTYTYQVAASDPDGDTLTYSLGCPSGGDCSPATIPAGMTINSSTGLITWANPSPVAQGNIFHIVVAVSDVKSIAVEEYDLTVVPGPIVLDHVVISPSSATVPIGETRDFTAQAYDTEGELITSGVSYTWSVGGGIGTVSPTSGPSTTFTAGSSAGAGTVDVSATFGDQTATDSATVSVTIGPDTTPPAAITDLSTSNPTRTTLKLTWTAPGDDGNVGTAAGYDIRYSTSTITDANWGSASQVSGEPTPQAAGSSETFTVSGLSPDTTYSFAIKTADEVPLWSALSNIAQGKTTKEEEPAVLNITLLMQGRPSYPSDSRGSNGIVDVFARAVGGTDRLWEVDDLEIAAAGTAGDISLEGLASGETYEFLLKGYIHLTVKKSLTLNSSNSINFGTLLTGDLNSTRDDQVNSLDNDILLTGWQQTWNDPQACPDNYADCKLADFNLDSKVNSIDHDYIFTNWGKNGDE